MLPNNQTNNLRKENYSLIQPTVLGVLGSQTLDISKTLKKETTASEHSLKHGEPETDLINFNVTPQPDQQIDKEKQISDLQIKMLEEFLSTAGNSNPKKSEMYSPEQEKQFQKFFDKYETENPAINEKDFTTDGPRSSKINSKNSLRSPNIIYPQLQKLNIDETNADEDLIDEVLLEKNLEKLRLKTSSDQRVYDVSLKADNNLVFENNDTNNKIDAKNRPNLTVLDEKILHAPILSNRANTNTKQTKINQNNHVKLFHKQESHKLHDNTEIKDLVEKHNIKYLEAIKKDEKQFQKQLCFLKNDEEKRNLTPGPTLYEKSVALPQMMHRLDERNKEILELIKMRRRVRLDRGRFISMDKAKNITFVSSVKPNIRPYCDTCDQNKITKDLTTSSKVSYSNISKDYAAASKFKQVLAAKNIESVSKHELRFMPVDQLRALKRERAVTGPGPSSLDSGAVSSHVLRGLQLLTDNHNKERYVDYATSRLFEDFINGK